VVGRAEAWISYRGFALRAIGRASFLWRSGGRYADGMTDCPRRHRVRRIHGGKVIAEIVPGECDRAKPTCLGWAVAAHLSAISPPELLVGNVSDDFLRRNTATCIGLTEWSRLDRHLL